MVIMVKAFCIPSDFNHNLQLEYERSFHWNIIVFEESFVLGERIAENPQALKSAFWLYFKCAENTRLWLSAVIVLR